MLVSNFPLYLFGISAKVMTFGHILLKTYATSSFKHITLNLNKNAFRKNKQLWHLSLEQKFDRDQRAKLGLTVHCYLKEAVEV